MNKCIYRNIFYITQNISEFFRRNKLRLFFILISLVAGVTIGLCVGIKNCNTFTLLNCTDKNALSLIAGGNALWYFIKQVLLSAFIIALIVILTNFKFLSFLNYFLFAYISFCLMINCTIFCCLFHLAGIIFSIFYFIFNIIIILLFATIFLVCKCSSDCDGSSAKLTHYPYKVILLLLCLIAVMNLLLMALCLICRTFI